MSNSELYQSKIGISIVVMSLSVYVYASESEYSKGSANPSDTCINEDMFSKQSMNEERYPLVKLLETKKNNYDDDVIEIPIVKRMRFKFGKPKIKIFEA
jgi:hypothetical protein